jgi:uncharacterized damage-inducible protein DinB
MSQVAAIRAREILKYTLWADRKVLAAVRQIEPEHLIRDAGASFGSLLGTFAHILGAEQVWLSRFVGNPLTPLPSVSDYPDLAALEAGFEELWPQMEFFLASLDDAQLQGPLRWTNSRGETHNRVLWQAVVHMVNHSTYHRGQIVMLLRQMGYEPPSSDLIYFFPEADL